MFIDDIGPEAFEVLEKYPFVSGITTNSTILKRGGFTLSRAIDVLSKVRGKHFVQISIENIHWKKVLSKAGRDKFVTKVVWVPGKSESVANHLKEMGFEICATAVYTVGQIVSASEYGVEWIAVYYDRMVRNGLNPHEVVKLALKKGMKVLIASLKSPKQTEEVIKLYDVNVTLPVSVFKRFFEVDFPEKDLEKFEEDFKL